MNLRTLALTTTLAFAPVALFAQTTTVPSTPRHQSTINQRKGNQQDRIGQGVTKGTLNANEASRLERQEAGINREERGMKAQDNGHLTKQDRRALRHRQNVESKRIYRTKHDIGHK